MKKVAFIANVPFTIYNFRQEIISEFISRGYQVVIISDTTSKLEGVNDLRQVRFVHWSLSRRGLNPFYELLSLMHLVKILKIEKPELCLNYTIKPVIYGSIAEWICHIHQSFSFITGLGFVFIGKGIKNKILQIITQVQYKIALNFNKNVFFQNTDDQRLFIDHGLVRKDKTVVINGSGINLEKFKAIPEQKIPQSFILIARLLKDKGIYEYVEACRSLKKDFPQAHFLLLGPYDDNPAAIQPSEVEAWNKEGIVEYLGVVKDTREMMAKSEVCVLPSYREGTPRTVLECMCMELPAIVTDVPGCRETVIDGHNGFLVKVNDAVTLAAAMRKFLENPELIKTMGKKARAFCEEKYDVNKVNQVILKTIESSQASHP